MKENKLSPDFTPDLLDLCSEKFMNPTGRFFIKNKRRLSQSSVKLEKMIPLEDTKEIHKISQIISNSLNQKEKQLQRFEQVTLPSIKMKKMIKKAKQEPKKRVDWMDGSEPEIQTMNPEDNLKLADIIIKVNQFQVEAGEWEEKLQKLSQLEEDLELEMQRFEEKLKKLQMQTFFDVQLGKINIIE